MFIELSLLEIRVKANGKPARGSKVVSCPVPTSFDLHRRHEKGGIKPSGGLDLFHLRNSGTYVDAYDGLQRNFAVIRGNHMSARRTRNPAVSINFISISKYGVAVKLKESFEIHAFNVALHDGLFDVVLHLVGYVR